MFTYERLYGIHKAANNLALEYYLRKGFVPAKLSEIVTLTSSPSYFLTNLHKYSPDQPRVPAGNADGGQWTSGSGDGLGIDDPPIIPVYPIEALLSLFSGGSIAKILKNVVMSLIGAAVRGSFDSDTEQVIQSIEDFFGGAPDKAFTNPAGDLIMMTQNKKIRFDINNYSHHDAPHFHIEILDENGNWTDAGNQHWYPFLGE